MTPPQKPENIHRRKLFDGRTTAAEVHARHVFAGKKCNGCGGPPAIRIRSFVPADWLLREKPEVAMELAALHGGSIPCVDFTMGRYVRVGDAFACALCRRTCEREAAKAPSYFVMQIDEGPGPEKTVSAVPGLTP